ncbi:hypothetical protein Prudu_007157, partial [Prunus dulcis]
SLEFILLSFSMEDFRRCLERQERETNERNLIAVALQDEENQGRRRVHKSAAAGMWTDIGIL